MKPETVTTKHSANNVEPFPSQSIEAYVIAADAIEADLWNLIVDHIDEDFPTLWMVGILDSLKAQVAALDEE